jgi:UDP-N-acetylglucosamine 3-dehydrogenase
MNGLRVGVIGLGYFGERHSRVYHRLNHVQLVAVCDRDRDRANRLAAELGAQAYGDFRELLARSDIDAVSICMPDRDHTEATVAAAEAKKAILLEKPLAHDIEHARKIVAAVEANDVRFMVGHILRFDPRYVQVYQASRPERLGRPLHVKAKRNSIRANAKRVGSNASILFYMGVHDVDAMQWVARSRISRVYAQKIEELGHGNEDALYAVVNFENGAIGCIDYSWAWPDGLMNGFKSSLEIVGTLAGAFLDCSEQGYYEVSQDRTVGGDTHLWPEINGRIVGDLGDEIAHFVDAVESGRSFVQHYREALDNIPVLDALRESARTGAVTAVKR